MFSCYRTICPKVFLTAVYYLPPINSQVHAAQIVIMSGNCQVIVYSHFLLLGHQLLLLRLPLLFFFQSLKYLIIGDEHMTLRQFKAV